MFTVHKGELKPYEWDGCSLPLSYEVQAIASESGKQARRFVLRFDIPEKHNIVLADLKDEHIFYAEEMIADWFVSYAPSHDEQNGISDYIELAKEWVEIYLNYIPISFDWNGKQSDLAKVLMSFLLLELFRYLHEEKSYAWVSSFAFNSISDVEEWISWNKAECNVKLKEIGI